MTQAIAVRQEHLPHLDWPSRYALAKTNPAALSNGRTAEMRRAVVRGFLDGRPIEEIGRQDVEMWRAGMEAKGLARSTQYQRVSVISQFFQYAIAHGLVSRSPVPNGKWRGGFRPKPYDGETTKALTAREVKAFFEAIPQDTVAGLRLRAMVKLMLTLGLRSAEVCNIRWQDCSFGNGKPTLRCRTKGGKWRGFELTGLTLEAILDYLEAANRNPREGEALFTPLTRKGFLSTYSLWQAIKKLGKVCGLPHIGCHTWRHTHAELYSESGASLPEIQGSLGHRSPRTTTLYLSALRPQSAKAGEAVEGMISM